MPPKRGQTTRTNQGSKEKEGDTETLEMSNTPTIVRARAAVKTPSPYPSTQSPIGRFLAKGPETSKMESIEQKLDMIVKTVEKMATREYIDSKLNDLVTKEVLESNLQSVKVDIRLDMMKEVSTVRVEIEKLQGELFDIKNTNEQLKINMERLEREKAERKEQYGELVSLNESLKRKIGDMEQYTRIDNIKLFGIDDTNRNETNTETLTKVTQFLQDNLHVTIKAGEISTAHRLGQFKHESNRPIICKCVMHDTKLSVLQRRKTLKGTRVVIRDDVTQFSLDTLDKASKAAGVESAWIYDCKVFVKLYNGRRVRIYSTTDLRTLS